MHPILFEIPKFSLFFLSIGPIEIRWYGVMIAVAFLSSLHFGVWRGRKRGLNGDTLVDLGVWLLVSALLGSRVLYVLAEWDEYRMDPIEALKFWRGGLVFYGGVLGAVPVGIYFVKRKGLPLWRVADVAAPCIALGHGLGRIGCFLNGCCFGHRTDSPMGVIFGPDSSAWNYFGGPVRVHPVNLYEAVVEFSVCALILLTERRRLFEGQSFSLYLLSYGTFRLLLEGLREGNPRILLGLTGSQVLSVIAILAGAIIAGTQWRRASTQANGRDHAGHKRQR